MQPRNGFRLVATVGVIWWTLTWALAAYAEPVVCQPFPAAARLYAYDQGGRSIGSGVLIDVRDGTGLVLTCWHLFSDSAERIEVEFPGDKQWTYGGNLIAYDKTQDLALVLIVDPKIQPVRIASERPKLGARYWSCGFGDGQFAVNEGTGVQYVGMEGSREFDTLEISGRNRHGDSGGPILNEAGEVTAIQFGRGGNSVDGACSDRIHAFLSRHEIQLTQYYEPCANGKCWRPGQVIHKAADPQPSYTNTPAPRPPVAAKPCDCSATIAQLEARIKTLESREAIPGPPGPKGDKGDPSAPAAVDVDVIASKAADNAVAQVKRIPFKAQLTDASGRTSETYVYLGGTDPSGKANALKLRLNERLQPLIPRKK